MMVSALSSAFTKTASFVTPSSYSFQTSIICLPASDGRKHANFSIAAFSSLVFSCLSDNNRAQILLQMNDILLFNTFKQKTPPFQKQRRRLLFFVNIATTTNFQNKHDESTLIDLENDPEIANALSKRVRMTFQPCHACIRKGVFRQFH